MNRKDCYQILGISKNASQQEIRQAYRKLAFQYHPDKNGNDPEASEKMKQINEAYAILSNPVKRREYDAFGTQFGEQAYEHFRQKYSYEDIFRGSDINQIFDELSKAFGFRNSSDVLNQFYGPGYRTYEFRRPGFFGKGFVFYHTGGNPNHTKEQTMDSDQRQPQEVAFSGTLGKLLKLSLRKSLGLKIPEKGKDLVDTIAVDPERAASGGEIEYLHEAGEKPKNLMVKVPAGIKEGQRIRLRGMGAPGKDGGEPGDLYLKMKISVPLIRRIKNLFR